MSGLLNIAGLFCKRDLSKRLYSAKETYNLKKPTNRSHPIPQPSRANPVKWHSTHNKSGHNKTLLWVMCISRDMRKGEGETCVRRHVRCVGGELCLRHMSLGDICVLLRRRACVTCHWEKCAFCWGDMCGMHISLAPYFFMCVFRFSSIFSREMCVRVAEWCALGDMCVVLRRDVLTSQCGPMWSTSNLHRHTAQYGPRM